MAQKRKPTKPMNQYGNEFLNDVADAFLLSGLADLESGNARHGARMANAGIWLKRQLKRKGNGGLTNRH